MTDKERILLWLDNLVVYEKDYDILLRLLTTNDKFLITILKELAKGNLILDDFETVLGGPSYDRIVEEKFKQAEQVEESIRLILEANDFINNYDASIYNDIYKNLLLLPEGNEELIEEFTEEEIYSFFNNTPESNILYREHKAKLLDYYYDNIIDKNFLNRYIGVPIIPINYNDIILNEEDKKFALRKGISFEEVKKLKSLNYYYKSKGVSHGN